MIFEAVKLHFLFLIGWVVKKKMKRSVNKLNLNGLSSHSLAEDPESTLSRLFLH
jgi:hypothetical protein